MRRIILMAIASVLLISVGAAAQDSDVTLLPSTPAGAAATPRATMGGNEFPLRLAMSYEYTSFRSQPSLTAFHNNGIDTDLTGYLGHGFALEGNLEVGFGSAVYTLVNPPEHVTLTADSLFYGGGVRIGPEHGRFQPWGHALIGGERFVITQTSPSIGHNNGLAYQFGGGADIKVGPRAYWRVEADYLGTHVVSIQKNNYQFGTGLAFTF